MAKDLQTPFDVAVVMFTKRTGSLADAVRSVFAQHFSGRVQIVVGADGPTADRPALAALAREVPETMALTVVDPGYSTARSRGGMYAPEAGGVLRAALTLLANARHVAYLSEANRYAPHHLDLLKRAISDRAWAHALRWFSDARTGQVICRDEWESVGPGQGVYAKSEGGFAAADTLLIDKLACHAALAAWTEADAKGRGEDRRFFRAIRALPHAVTGEPSVYAGIDVAQQHPFMLAQFRAHGVILERFVKLTPELEAEVARAAEAQRAYAEGVRGRMSFGGVEFGIKRDK
ncbi:hypothetical protein BURK1_02417 [Burkholderiales bacterium]|nr:hypothetical protein BURK1_02417 [Burkholderiales bacterium]